MLTLPDAIISVLQPFSILFRHRTWTKAQLLLVGAVLAPRRRTITSALRVMGLSDDAGFAKYHHVLSRAVWHPLQLSRVLLAVGQVPGRGVRVRHPDCTAQAAADCVSGASCSASCFVVTPGVR